MNTLQIAMEALPLWERAQLIDNRNIYWEIDVDRGEGPAGFAPECGI
jgi:hypothetical protein